MAVGFGVWDVDVLKSRLTAKALLKWEAYAQLEPFYFDRELRQDYRIASIVRMIANVNRGKDQKPYSLNDMILKFDEWVEKIEKVEDRKSPEEQQRILNLWAIALSGDRTTE